MKNLIEKTTILTDEQYKERILEAQNHTGKLMLAILILILLIVTVQYIAEKCNGFISTILTLTQGLFTILIFLSFTTIMYLLIFTNPKDKSNIPITEIKEHIKIDNNRLTIDALPENYQYKDNKLDKTKPHDFKIDDFYKESNVKLIDSNNNSYDITHEQLEELKQ